MLISELIVREELIGLLADLVTINSVNPAYDPASNEKKIAAHIRAVLSDWRIPAETQEVFPDRCNVIARIEGKDPSRNLVFGDALCAEDPQKIGPAVGDQCSVGSDRRRGTLVHGSLPSGPLRPES